MSATPAGDAFSAAAAASAKPAAGRCGAIRRSVSYSDDFGRRSAVL